MKFLRDFFFVIIYIYLNFEFQVLMLPIFAGRSEMVCLFETHLCSTSQQTEPVSFLLVNS